MVRKVPPTLWILVAKGMKVFCSEGVEKIKYQKQRDSSDYCLTLTDAVNTLVALCFSTFFHI